MTDIQQHYQEVAVVLASHVPEGWQKAWADVVVRDDTSKQTYDYIGLDGKKHWFDVDGGGDATKIYRNLRAVRDHMAQQTGETWKSVRFTVEPSGKFHTKFNYDD